jgi:Tfp pilus assembly protein PilF
MLEVKMNRKILCLFAVLFFFLALMTAPAASHKEYYETGKKAYKNKQYTDALKSFRAAVAEKPEIAKYSYNLGLAARKLKYYDEAYNAFIKARELDPGITFTKKKEDFHKKIEEMRGKAGRTEKKPANTSLSHKEYFESGKKAYKNKQYTQAYEYFKNAVALQADTAKYYYNLGLAAGKLKNYEAVYRAFLKAQELDPDLEFTNKRENFRTRLEEAKYQVDSKGGKTVATTTEKAKEEKKKGAFPFLPVAIGGVLIFYLIGRARRKNRAASTAPPAPGGEDLLQNDRSRVISSTQHEHGQGGGLFGKRGKRYRDDTYDDNRYYDDHTRDHNYKPDTDGHIGRRDVS